MYAPSYGYGPGNPTPFNPNGAAPHLNPHHHQQQQPGPGQQPQHMMYNPQQHQQQQYAVGGGPPQQSSSYGAAPGPGMGGDAGGMGMMPNSSMTHMGGVYSACLNLLHTALAFPPSVCYSRKEGSEIASLLSGITLSSSPSRIISRKERWLASHRHVYPPFDCFKRHVECSKRSLTSPLSTVAAYQTPYSTSPYGASIPTSSASNLPPNFMPTSSGAPSFPMNAPNMNQHQVQRMQPPPNSSTPTRASPFGGVPLGTPPNISTQSQFSPPQSHNQTHLQTPNNNQQSQAGTIITPQTPNFPPGSQAGNAGGSIASPLSPGSEFREKERVTLLLDINQVLLMEAVSLQASQAEAKKEETKENTGSPDGEKEKADKEKADKLKAASSREYVECMRRLQSNLAYLAAIADRSHKPSSQIPPHPAIMTAPSITSKPPLKFPFPDESETKEEDSSEKKKEKEEEPDEDRVEVLKDQYKRLQDLFPGVDFKKDAQMAAARQQASQKQADQQKMQNEMLRQKMMQAQQHQQRQQQQQIQNR
ncbi:hypothetical protein LCER1_G006595 [Lachnellula cervina]|uniref:Uncharacterized protein n=1 Tax=Lachnellula cervina TaxID=1316786 RepID=A0A7D8YP88_9HELO|nr:hypothetical protein LCER1_G006595 [Lachnellula cervina]